MWLVGNHIDYLCHVRRVIESCSKIGNGEDCGLHRLLNTCIRRTGNRQRNHGIEVGRDALESPRDGDPCLMVPGLARQPGAPFADCDEKLVSQLVPREWHLLATRSGGRARKPLDDHCPGPLIHARQTVADGCACLSELHPCPRLPAGSAESGDPPLMRIGRTGRATPLKRCP